MTRSKAAKKRAAAAQNVQQKRLPAPKPVIKVIATRQKKPVEKVSPIGSGALVRHIDRETISISHTFVWKKVDKSSYYGNNRIDIFDSPVIASMAGMYTRFRYRKLTVRWQPAVSTQTPGLIAFTCSTILGMDSTPDLVSLGAMPGTHLGVLYERGQSTCDMRVFKDEWFNIVKQHGVASGIPRVIFTSIGIEGTLEIAGFLTAEVTIEFTSPAYLPMTPSLKRDREEELVKQLEAIQDELATLTNSDGDVEEKADS